MDPKETAFNFYRGEQYGTFFTSDAKWIRRLHSLKEKNPDEVIIVEENEDGSLVAQVPSKWFKLSPPRKMDLTDEQREERRERLALSRKTGGKT